MQPLGPAAGTRLRPWHALLVGAALFAVLRLALPAAGTLPRTLTADEADALLGAKLLSEQLAPRPADEAPVPLTTRLRAGFETTASHPRLALVAPDRTAQRAALEAPLPRWLGALGIGALPTAPDASNLARTATSSALATALALALLVWGLRREGLLVASLSGALLLVTPGVVDAALSAGHGASALLVSVLFALLLTRVLSGRSGALAQLGLGAVVGLALGVHPLALVLFPVVLVAWAIRLPSPPRAPRATLALPAVPLLVLLIPVVALLTLIALWPALWSETGKRLGAWLLDFGSTPSPPHEVLGLVFDQASGRSAQAFTAVLQWVAWTPLPVLGLWLVGFACSVRAGRSGAWAPIATLFAWLAVGALDGGLFGGRNSLLAFLWLPTAMTAAHGVQATLAFVEARLAGLRPSPLVGLLRRRPGVRSAVVLCALLLAPLLQSVRGTTLGMARSTGAELRAAVPLALLSELARARPWAVIDLQPRREQLLPGLEGAREGLSLDLRSGTLAEADALLLTIPSGVAPPAPASPGGADAAALSPEVTARLATGRERARDARPGVIVSIWDLTVPGPLDKQPSLPHN